MFLGRVMFISVHGDPLVKLGGIQSGGQNVYVRETVQALDTQGVPVDVFTHWSDSESPQIEYIGSRSRVIRLAAGHKGFIPKNKMYDILSNFLEELKIFVNNSCDYSVIHSNYWLSGWVGLQLQKKKNIPRVHTSHSLGLVRKRNMAVEQDESFILRLRTEKEVLVLANRVVATTPEEKDILTRKYTVSPDKINMVPCGVNINLFQKPELFRTKDLKSRSRRNSILFVGRFEENKGLSVLLKALGVLKTKHSSMTEMPRLVIVGGDSLDISSLDMSPEKKKYIEIIEENGLSQMVEFIGPVDHKELSNYYSEAAITVVPSYYESFGLVAIEAMAGGCPVIASRTGGLQHTIKHGTTGLLVEPKNHQALAEAIDYLLNNENERKKMARNAAHYTKRYSWQGIAGELQNIYREVSLWQKYRITQIRDISLPRI